MRIAFDFNRATRRICVVVNGTELPEAAAWRLLWHVEAFETERSSSYAWPQTDDAWPLMAEGRPMTLEEMRTCQVLSVIGVMRPSARWVDVADELGVGREYLRRERERIGLKIDAQNPADYLPAWLIERTIGRMRPEASWGDIAEALGVSPDYLRERRHALGLEPPRQAHLDEEISDAHIKEVVGRHAPDYRWEDIAEELGVSLGYLRKRRRAMGWKVRRTGEALAEDLPDDELREIIEEGRPEMTWQQIAGWIGCSRQYLRQRRMELDGHEPLQNQKNGA